MRVLVVEDDDFIRAFIIAALRRSEPLIRIDSVSNGDDALAQYVTHRPYDIVITDQWHAGLHGMELIDAIRDINHAQAIILQSGNFGDLIDAFKHKYTDIPVLEKPFRSQELTDLVRSMEPCIPGTASSRPTY